MFDLLPHSVSDPTKDANDRRLGHWLATDRGLDNAEVVIVGFPSDEGVRRNGGRTGARYAPKAIREMLYKLTPDAQHIEPFVALLERTVDIGDIPISEDVETDQNRLSSILTELLPEKRVIILGGGHETSFGHYLGYAGVGLQPDVLNWDAHPDVRPTDNGLGHSGSPFRQMIEHTPGCLRYRVAGVQPHSTAAAHTAYIRENGGEFYWRNEVDRSLINTLTADIRNPGMVTFDVDAVDAANAPGVSAPNAGGLSADTWLYAAWKCGATPNVRSVDIVEVNPKYGVDGRTARLAALTAWNVLRGMAGSIDNG